MQLVWPVLSLKNNSKQTSKLCILQLCYSNQTFSNTCISPNDCFEENLNYLQIIKFFYVLQFPALNGFYVPINLKIRLIHHIFFSYLYCPGGQGRGVMVASGQ